MQGHLTSQAICKRQALLFSKSRAVLFSFHLLWEAFQVRAYRLHLCTSTLEKTGVSKYFQPHLKDEHRAAFPACWAALDLHPAVPTVSGQQ